MGMRKYIQNTKPRKLPSSFIEWRQKTLENAERWCEVYKRKLEGGLILGNRDTTTLSFKIKRFPATIKRLTRQMCECEEDCTLFSLSEIDFSICPMYDLDLDTFHDLTMVDKKVVNGSLVDINFKVEDELLVTDLKNYNTELCKGDDQYLRKLKCKSYEIRDNCKPGNVCYTDFSHYILPSTYEPCTRNFRSKVQSIWGQTQDTKLIFSQREKRDLQNSGSRLIGGYLALVICSCIPNLRNSKSNLLMGLSLLSLLFLYVEE